MRKSYRLIYRIILFSYCQQPFSHLTCNLVTHPIHVHTDKSETLCLSHTTCCLIAHTALYVSFDPINIFLEIDVDFPITL